jgi:hypothetical protein
MGHEIVVHRDRHAIINDMDFWALRHFLLEVAESIGPDELATFVRGWDWIGPGVYLGVDFDNFFDSNPEREQEFLALLSAVVRRLQAFGTHVPLAYLQRHINLALAYYTAEQPVEQFLKEIEGIRALFLSS